jgi:pimeloyl-ACP methyl ester carboxylesterase
MARGRRGRSVTSMTATATSAANVAINGVRLFYEVHGAGAPILCIHGAGGTTLAWAEPIANLARLGRVIAYDRRGCARSDRPAYYERTSIAEHADDAAALATIRQPTLLVAAADSPPEFREPVDVLAAALPNARKALVGGGHLIDPAAPEVLAFVEEVLGQP